MDTIKKVGATAALVGSAILVVMPAQLAKAEIDIDRTLSYENRQILVKQDLPDSQMRSQPQKSDMQLAPIPHRVEELRQNEAVSESQVIEEQSYPVLEPRPEVSEEVLESLRVSVTYNGQALVNGYLGEANVAEQASNNEPVVARNRYLPEYRHTLGLDLPTFGWNQYRDGGLKSILGFNGTVGISYRSYFQPVEEDKFNLAYDVGTLGLVLPYATIGGDYQSEGDFYAGIHIGVASLWYIDSAAFIPFGWVGVGVRLGEQ